MSMLTPDYIESVNSGSNSNTLVNSVAIFVCSILCADPDKANASYTF